jgi:hypothetical protein
MESSHAHHASLSAPVTAVDTGPHGIFTFTDQVFDRPPTTNLLRPWERADLVRKNRKLTQLLGETPSPLSVTSLRTSARASSVEPSSRAGRYRTGRASPTSAHLIDTLRRHSSPPSPIETVSYVELSQAGEGGGHMRGKDMERGNRGQPESDAVKVIESASFMDLSLSDDENPSFAHVQSPHSFRSPPPSRPFDSPDSMANLYSPDDERRRRREKIAKLHRFLGSHVPTSLVLGLNDVDDALPALDPPVTNSRPRYPNRRRSSSAAEFKRNWFGSDDRVKEELDEREKAINVRRAVKMEKMFGVQPPQTLYHTRHTPKLTDRVHSTEWPSHTEREAVRPAGRNVNQSSYVNKGNKVNRHRAGSHSESIIPLLDPPGSPGSRASAIYMHYRYSLDSLSEIIDRDDRESLAELHSILTNDQPGAEGYITPTREDGVKNVRSERRRSLPTRSSNLSLASQFNLSSPSSPEMASFQARRRQAAKLTHFFGVEYRDLIGDILESIEHDVQEESHRGSLRPEEIQDLLVKLRTLKTKRSAAI